MTHKPATDAFADDEFQTTSADEAWSAEPSDDGADLSAGSSEGRLELERPRRDLEELPFESSHRFELD
jgi:hypothetical protein